MGVETYILKCKVTEVYPKVNEIIEERRKVFSTAMHTENYIYLNDTEMQYMDAFKPDVEWIKANHVTAWFVKNHFQKPLNENPCAFAVLTRADLVDFCKDCQKILGHYETTGNKKRINKRYCEAIFPYLDWHFSGNIAYDEDFIEEIRMAKRDIDKLLLTISPAMVFLLFVDA